MELHKRINADYMTAMKEKNTIKKNILGILKSELKNRTIEDRTEFVSDENVQAIINKILKGIKQTLSLTTSEDDKHQLSIEISVLEDFLPQMMSKVEIESIIRVMFENDTNLNIGSVMKRFANESVDKKMVSEIFKELSNQ